MLSTQHLRDRGRWISVFVASLIYIVISKTAKATQTLSKKTKQ